MHTAPHTPVGNAPAGSRVGTRAGGLIWDIQAVYTHPDFRREYYCAQRLICKVLANAREAGVAGVSVTAQHDSIRRDCMSRGFEPTGKSFDDSTMLLLRRATPASS
jgi:hypothetical protein